MSPRRRTRRTKAAYPALTRFARAYLHEEFVQEYGGAVEAVRAFRADATAEECRALAAELEQLAEASSGWPPARLAEFVARTIRAAWATPSSETLREMAAELGASRR